MQLRPYQLSALAQTHELAAEGARRVMIVAPTGAGKTVILAELARRAVARGRRVAVFAHRRELVIQAAKTLRSFELDVGYHGLSRSAPIQIATVQGAQAGDDYPPGDVVVLDECVTPDTIVGGKSAGLVRPGDIVESWSGTTVVRREVQRVFVNVAATLRTIHVGSRALTVTDAHPIWVEGFGFAYARDIAEGDVCRVRLSNEEILARAPGDTRRGSAQRDFSSLARVDRVEVHERGSDGSFGGRAPHGLVYNFTIAGERNFFADGVLTHNCHHYVSDEWSELPKRYEGKFIIGATATPERGDGRGLAPLFQKLVVCASIAELQKSGVLVPLDIRRPSKMLRADQIAQRPVDAYLDNARNSQAVVFAQTVKRAQSFAEEFNALGVKAACVFGETETDERDATLRRFHDGEIRVLCNVAVLTEGWDCPPAATCILARGCGSVSLMVQMVGRVLRAAVGKLGATMLDLRGITYALGRPDQELDYSLEGDGIRRKGATVGERFCPVCQALLGDLTTCPECGKVTNEEKRLTVTNEKLVYWKDDLRKDDDATRERRLCKWASESGNPSSANFKFKAVYGAFPTRDMMMKAGTMWRPKARAP